MARNRNRRGGAERKPEAETQTVSQSDVGQVSAAELEGNGERKIKFAEPLKYEGLQASAKEGNLDYNPKWAKKDVRFKIGSVKPKGDKSVMGMLYTLVHQNQGDSGIKGAELAAIVRYTEFPNRNRSKYLDGIPPIGWAEGYIDGAVTDRILSMVKVDGQSTDGRTRAGKAAAASPPKEPEESEEETNGEDEVDETEDNGDDENGATAEDSEEGERGGKTGESHPERSPTGATPESREVNEAGEFGKPGEEGGEKS